MTDQEKTIGKIERSMRKWIEDNLSLYETMSPSQEVRSTQGDYVLKANPAAQEIRAAFKDYCYIVKTQKELSGGGEVADTSAIEEMRKRFKVIG